MSGNVYSVEVSNWDDLAANATFRIEPAVRFIHEGAQRGFGKAVIHLIQREVTSTGKEGFVEVSHHTPEHDATIGFAHLPVLRHGTGQEILQNALLTALNG